MTLFSPSLFRLFHRFHIIGALLALLAVVLPGCSAVKLGYNNAPEISYWWLDSYLDFNSAQTTKVRADLNALQAWHRQNELPAYVTVLEKLQRLAANTVTPAQVCEVYTEVMPRYQTLVYQLAPTIVAVAPTLQAEQLDHLARQLEKRSRKWREEWVEGTLAERHARRVKQWVDRLEMLYGTLDEPQLAVLRASVAASVFDAALTYKESQRRHQDALQTLRQLQPGMPGAAHAETEVHELLSRAMNAPDPATRSHMGKITQENCTTLAKLHNNATPAQRLKLLETLKAYEADARTLMATPK